MKIAFNTGRLYTSAGQRIGAWVENDVCYFVDFDRMVTGYFKCLKHCIGSNSDFAKHIVYIYDKGQYNMEVIIDGYEKLRNVERNGYEAFTLQPDTVVVRYTP